MGVESWLSRQVVDHERVERYGGAEQDFMNNISLGSQEVVDCEHTSTSH